MKSDRGDVDRAAETGPPPLPAREKTEPGEGQRKEGTARTGAGTGLALAGRTEVSDGGVGCQQSLTGTDRRHGGGGRMPSGGLSPP